MAFMKLPKGTTSVGYGGKEYPPNKQKVVEVPDEAVEQLLRHGLTYVDPPDEETEEERIKREEEEKKKKEEEEKKKGKG